ncbi:DUF2523 domain-containing protein [Aquabacterium sp.]|uniref:DUF2523 domain-containing protein n=1 Tax=Aquabacterium sp. TaxID=1872578 RepID=UPI0037831132
MPLIAPIIGALLGALAGAVGNFVGRILVSLGLGYVVYQGVDTSIGWAKAQVVSHLQALPADALGMLAVMKIGTCVSILCSALVVRVTIAGIVGGAKKMTVK